MLKTISVCVAVVLVAGGWAVYSFAQDKPKEKAEQPKVKWEYKVVKPKSDPAECEAELNRLGEEGWELSESLGNSVITHVFLKRPKR